MAEIAQMENQTYEAGFWDDPAKAQELISQLNRKRDIVKGYQQTAAAYDLSLIHIADKEAADGIENHQRAGIAQMDIVINSGTATVYAYLPRLNGDKLLFARMLGIIEPDRHGILPCIDSNISTARLKQTAVLLR